jgi:hypothetical protein
MLQHCLKENGNFCGLFCGLLLLFVIVSSKPATVTRRKRRNEGAFNGIESATRFARLLRQQ